MTRARQDQSRLKCLVFRSTALAAAAAMIATSSSCAPRGYSGPAEPITIGMESTAVNSLIYIADEQKYLEANGIAVTIKDAYPSGSAAAEAMLNGEADMATTAELAIVRQAFAKQQILTLASIDMFMHMKLITRKDNGIQGASGLEGKRIGVPLRSAADFMLGRFLELASFERNKVTIVDVQAPQAVNAIVDGDVDAVVAWQPNVLSIQDKLGDNVSVLDVQSGQPLYCALVTTSALATRNPRLLERFVNALAQAEAYTIHNPDEARAAIQKRLGYDDRYIGTIWPAHQLSLRLDQSIIIAMEDQARWMIGNNLTAERTVPNFMDYVSERALKTVKPEAVDIIR